MAVNTDSLSIVKFQDESLRIARQYKGGLGLYGQSEEDALSDSEKDSDSFTDESLDDSFTSGSLSSQAVSSYHSDMIKSSPSRTYSSTPQQWKHQTLPPTDTVGVKYYPTPVGLAYLNSDAMTSSSSDSHTGNQMLTPADSQSADDIHAAAYRNLASYSGFDSYVHSEDSGSKLNVSSPRSPPLSRSQSSSRSLASDDEREYLSSLEDVQYLQTFNDDIAVWMNAFDPERHFEKSIPHRAMECPTLLSALLACGASSVGKQIAHCHYDTATQRIMSVKGRLNVDEIIDGDDLAELAAAAVVLYVFETATSTLERKAIHTSEARDMIQQGRWDGSSPGLGGACFWLFVVTEVLTCLAMNWQVSWKPDAWAVDMDMGFADGQVSDFSDGKDEIWVHRIFYILAKVSDFRATASKFDMTDPRQMLGERLPQWRQLEKLCEKWKATCPLTMRPYAYINPGAPGLKSRFPFIRFVSPSSLFLTGRCADCCPLGSLPSPVPLVVSSTTRPGASSRRRTHARRYGSPTR